MRKNNIAIPKELCWHDFQDLRREGWRTSLAEDAHPFPQKDRRAMLLVYQNDIYS